MDIKVKENLEWYQKALGTNAIQTELQTCYILAETLMKVLDLGGEFSIKDAAEIKAESEKYAVKEEPKLTEKDFEQHLNDVVSEEATKAMNLGKTPQRSDKWLACEKYLKQLPDGYRERALSQMDEGCIKKNYISSHITFAICYFNDWRNTKEDYDFWNAVDDHYRFGKPLPQLPND